MIKHNMIMLILIKKICTFKHLSKAIFDPRPDSKRVPFGPSTLKHQKKLRKIYRDQISSSQCQNTHV
jgi:hypothetical protein